MRLNESPVIFDERTHKYTLKGKRLMGVTGMIHAITGLGVYPEASDYVSDVLIPKAGSRGTAIHHAIQTYDAIGVKQPFQTVDTEYGCAERNNIEIVKEEWDVSRELDNYIKHLVGYKPISNEYTVSDGIRYASQIDNVWENVETQGIWLVDTKSNNLAYYPKSGYGSDDCFYSGEEALKEYLSWQLSIYAELFEDNNPGLKVEGLACNWLREDKSAFWIIERKPSELVWELLKTEYSVVGGKVEYHHPNPSIFGTVEKLSVKDEEKPAIICNDTVLYLVDLIKQQSDISAKLDEAKAGLKKAMQEYNVKSFDNEYFKATLTPDTEKTSFDSTRFKKDYPELYEKYKSTKPSKGYLTIKIK